MCPPAAPAAPAAACWRSWCCFRGGGLGCRCEIANTEDTCAMGISQAPQMDCRSDKSVHVDCDVVGDSDGVVSHEEMLTMSEVVWAPPSLAALASFGFPHPVSCLSTKHHLHGAEPSLRLTYETHMSGFPSLITSPVCLGEFVCLIKKVIIHMRRSIYWFVNLASHYALVKAPTPSCRDPNQATLSTCILLSFSFFITSSSFSIQFCFVFSLCIHPYHSTSGRFK